MATSTSTLLTMSLTWPTRLRLATFRPLTVSRRPLTVPPTPPPTRPLTRSRAWTPTLTPLTVSLTLSTVPETPPGRVLSTMPRLTPRPRPETTGRPLVMALTLTTLSRPPRASRLVGMARVAAVRARVTKAYCILKKECVY